MAYSKDFQLKVLTFVDRGESEAAVVTSSPNHDPVIVRESFRP
jgi:hypothetical protein